MSETSLPLFDSVASEAAKERGMKRAADRRSKALEYARSVAKNLARIHGEISADHVQKILLAEGIELKNAAGSLFRDPAFEWTGRFTKSDRENAHRNRLMLWRLR